MKLIFFLWYRAKKVEGSQLEHKIFTNAYHYQPLSGFPLIENKKKIVVLWFVTT